MLPGIWLTEMFSGEMTKQWILLRQQERSWRHCYDWQHGTISCWLWAAILPSQGRKKLLRFPSITALTEREFHSHPLTFTSCWEGDWSEQLVGLEQGNCTDFLHTQSTRLSSERLCSRPLFLLAESIKVRVRTICGAKHKFPAFCSCGSFWALSPVLCSFTFYDHARGFSLISGCQHQK